MGEQVALLDQLALLEGDPVDLAVDTGPHHDGIETLNRPESGQIDREIASFYGCDADGNRPGRRGVGFIRAVMFAPSTSPKRVTAARQGDHDDKGRPTKNSRPGHWLWHWKIGTSKIVRTAVDICVHIMCKHTIP
ncbi:MAG: hypothetical protein NTAFB05_15820 [Nitrobacter sp.]